MSKKLKFTLIGVKKVQEQPLRPKETPQTFIESLLIRWKIEHYKEILMRVNGDLVENPPQNDSVEINQNSQVRIKIIGFIKLQIEQDMIAFESEITMDFEQLKKHILKEIFSLDDRISIKLKHEGVELKDSDCVIDISHNPKISVVLMTIVNFRGQRTISMNMDLNASLVNVIESLQKQFGQTIIALKYKNKVIMEKLRIYISKPDETVDVEFEDEKRRALQLTVKYEEDSREFQIKLTSKMEEFVQQLRKSFNDIQNNKIKLFQCNTELAQSGNVIDIILNYKDVIILERIGSDETIDIFLVKKGKNGPRQRKQINTNDKVSTLNQYFPKLTINYYYNNKQLIRDKSFYAQKIKQAQSVIEFEEVQGEFKKFIFIDVYTEATKEITLNSNEILHNQICKLLGEDNDEYWACLDCKTVIDTKKPLSTYDFKDGFILYGLLTMYLKVKYQGDTQKIKVYKEDNVIDLYVIFREKFKISIDQDFEITYDDKKIDDIHLYKLWAKGDGVYEIVLLEKKLPEQKIQQKFTIFVTHLNKPIEFEASPENTITSFIKKLLIFLQFPINQPCELTIDGNSFQIGSEEKLSDSHRQIELSINDQIVIHLKERDSEEEHYPDKPFQSRFRELLEEYNLKDCVFYHHGKQIDVEKTFQELNIFNMDLIEFERRVDFLETKKQEDYQQEAKNQVIRIPEEQYTTIPERESISKIVSENQQKSGIISKISEEQNSQISSYKTATFSEQNQAKNNLNNIEQEITTSQPHNYKITSSMVPHTEATQTMTNIEIKIKKTIELRIGGKEVEMDIEVNLTIGQLKQMIMEKHNQNDDIVIKQDGCILKEEELITNYEQLFLVVPNVIKIITVSKTKEYEHSFKPNAKVQELFVKMQYYYKQNFQLIFNKVQLRPEQTFREAGLKNLSKVQMKY